MDEFDLLKAISHPIRARVIELLSENVELSYSEILDNLKIDSGQLNFHLRNMSDLIHKGENGNYILTLEGKIARAIFRELTNLSKKDEKAIEPAAPILKRITAALIDFSLFLFSPMLVVVIVSYWVSFTHVDPVTLTLFLHAIFALTFAVFVAMEAYHGQTLGKFAMGIRVVKVNGRKPNLTECILRNIAKVYFLPLDLLVGTLFYRSKGYIRFSDYFSKVRVIDVSRRSLNIGSADGDAQKIPARR